MVEMGLGGNGAMGRADAKTGEHHGQGLAQHLSLASQSPLGGEQGAGAGTTAPGPKLLQKGRR